MDGCLRRRPANAGGGGDSVGGSPPMPRLCCCCSLLAASRGRKRRREREQGEASDRGVILFFFLQIGTYINGILRIIIHAVTHPRYDPGPQIALWTVQGHRGRNGTAPLSFVLFLKLLYLAPKLVNSNLSQHQPQRFKPQIILSYSLRFIL